MSKNSTDFDLRLVVDLDSNLNGHSTGQVPRRKHKKAPCDGRNANGENQQQEEDMIDGYNRYFARPATPDWYTDVSGYELTEEEFDIKGGSSEEGDPSH
ncbi:hypothetical protein PG991_001039 [Apiospora marii]|uniref:Uncharacterized protein n=2 Tax=Apiospora marii TaxID=335849 RepID=A0ABR1STP6_9PEZI